MFEALQANTAQHLEALGQRDLVLHERSPGFQVLAIMRRDIAERGARLTEHRIENIDRVGGGRTIDDRAVIVILVLDTGDQRVGEAHCLEVAGQVELEVVIGPLQLAVIEVTIQRHVISGNAVGLDCVALEGTVQVLITAGQGPVVIELMLETQLHHVIVVMQHVVGALLPVIGGMAGLTTLPRVMGQATVERVVVTHEITFEGDARGVGHLPAEHRSDTVALALHIVTEAVTALAHHVEAIGQAALFVQRAAGVQRATAQALVGELTADGGALLVQRLLGDHVEGATGVATAIQRCGRATQHFHTFQGIGIRRVGITAIDREAVAIELTSGETTHGKGGKALAAEVVGAANAASLIERLLQTSGGDVVDYIARHHADRLGRFMQGGIGARGAGRASGRIALHGPCRTFTGAGNHGVGQLERTVIWHGQRCSMNSNGAQRQQAD